MIIIYVLLIFIALFLIVSFIVSRRGIPRNLESSKRAIQDLLNRGFNGGFLVIKIRRNSEKFVQFYKYIEKNSYGIVLSFPLVEWSKLYENKFRELCSKSNLKIDEKDKTFLDVDFKKDIDLAHSFFKQLVTDVFNEEQDIKFYVNLENASSDIDAVITK